MELLSSKGLKECQEGKGVYGNMVEYRTILLFIYDMHYALWSTHTITTIYRLVNALVSVLLSKKINFKTNKMYKKKKTCHLQQ